MPYSSPLQRRHLGQITTEPELPAGSTPKDAPLYAQGYLDERQELQPNRPALPPEKDVWQFCWDYHQTKRNFHLDHLAPVSKDGTSHEIQNCAPMCPYHNIRKSNRQVALSQYRQEIAKANELMVDSIEDLISLDYALAHAMQIFGEAYARKYPQRRLPI